MGLLLAPGAVAGATGPALEAAVEGAVVGATVRGCSRSESSSGKTTCVFTFWAARPLVANRFRWRVRTSGACVSWSSLMASQRTLPSSPTAHSALDAPAAASD